MSSLIEHAKRELMITEPRPEIVSGYLAIIYAFDDVSRYGISTIEALETVEKLVKRETLTELSDDPKEWMEVGTDVWQSVRCDEAFSSDGGKTYYLLSEGGNEKKPVPLHETVKAKLSTEGA